MPAIAEPPAPTPTPAVPAPPPDKEELSFFEKNFGGRKEKKEAPKKDDKPPVAAEAKPAEKDDEKKPDAPAPKAKTKKADPVPVPVPETVDYDRMGKAIGDGVSTALDQRDKKKEQVELVLDDANRETLAMIERLEKKFPTIYKGRGDRFLKSLPVADAYETKWLANHPGQDFNEDDAEHESFFKSISLDDIQSEHIKIVERDGIIEEAADKAAKKFEPELNELRGEKKLREALPAIHGARVGAARGFFSELGDDYKAVLDKDGNISGTEIDRLTADPVKSVALHFAQSVEQFADDLHRLVNRITETDPRNVAGFVDDLEKRIRAMPATEQLWDGKHFATGEEWDKIPQERRANFWRLSEPYIAKCFVADQVANSKKAMEFEEEKLGKFAQARGYVKPQDGKSSERTTPEPPKETIKTPETPASPPGVIEPRMTLPAGHNPASNGSATKTFWSLFGGR